MGALHWAAASASMVTRRRLLMVPPAMAVAAVTRPGDVRAAGAVPAPEPVHRGPWSRAPYDTHVRNPAVADNVFLQMAPDRLAVPAFDQAVRALPEPSGRDTGRPSTATPRPGA